MRRVEHNTESLEKAIRQQMQASVIIHFNERFHEINAKLDGVLEPIFHKRVSDLQKQRLNKRQATEDTSPLYVDLMSNEKLIRHYLTYWLLQWDQYLYYHNGMLPEWIYDILLRQRYENYNLTEALDYRLPLDKERTGKHQMLLRTAESEQMLYRDSWDMAKKFFRDKKGFMKFAKHLEKVMQPHDPGMRERAISEMLTIGFMDQPDAEVL